ncbi:MAG: hypothetical protein ABFC57_18520 [Veillonellales bacterium]
MSCDDIVLSKDEIKSLKKLEKSGDMPLPNDIAKPLNKYNFVYQCSDEQDSLGQQIHNGKYQINDNGKRYLIYHNKTNKTKMIEWIRYLITTAIAVIALIISLMKS